MFKNNDKWTYLISCIKEIVGVFFSPVIAGTENKNMFIDCIMMLISAILKNRSFYSKHLCHKKNEVV
jgi:hypothetical protein